MLRVNGKNKKNITHFVENQLTDLEKNIMYSTALKFKFFSINFPYCQYLEVHPHLSLKFLNACHK